MVYGLLFVKKKKKKKTAHKKMKKTWINDRLNSLQEAHAINLT